MANVSSDFFIEWIGISYTRAKAESRSFVKMRQLLPQNFLKY